MEDYRVVPILVNYTYFGKTHETHNYAHIKSTLKLKIPSLPQ